MANIRWTEHVASLGVKRIKCKVLLGKPSWKVTIQKSWSRMGKTILECYLEEAVVSIHLAYDRDQCGLL
jgi:hypothetical protein